MLPPLVNYVNSQKVLLPILRCLMSSTSSATFVSESGLNSRLNMIGGQRVEGRGALLENINPATGEVLNKFHESTFEDVQEAIVAAKEAQKLWQDRNPMDRAIVLRAAAEIIRSDIERLTRLEVLDTGKTLWEAKEDILGCAASIDMYAGFATTLQGTHVHQPGHSFYYTRREPLGVCGGIGAWNYPFQMAVWKSAPALACGNAMVFKPSQLTPLTAVCVAEAYTKAGCPPGLFSVVQGAGETGTSLCNHPGIAKMSFTGSVSTGSRVMAASAALVRPLTLELGGKSPLIIFEDADLEEAAKGAVLANFLTQGQVCSNGTRVFVHKSVYPDFLKHLLSRVSKLKVGDPLDESVAVGAMISKAQFDISRRYIEGAVQEGATVEFGGEPVDFPKDSPLHGGYYLKPCVLSNCRDDMTVVREEVFGPVLSLLQFDSEEEVIRRANDSNLGLAGGAFTRDLTRAHRVAAELEVGTVYINNYNFYPPGIPFGGYKMSGFGRENGLETLHYYTQVKAVYVEAGRIDYPFQ